MAKKTKQAQSKNRLSLVALEPRMVFDGAIGVTDPTLPIRDHALDLRAIAEAAAKVATSAAGAASHKDTSAAGAASNKDGQARGSEHPLAINSKDTSAAGAASNKDGQVRGSEHPLAINSKDTSAAGAASNKEGQVRGSELLFAMGTREIVFVDDGLQDLPSLIAGIGTNAEVVQIRHGEDGLAQINAALSSRGTFDAIHILAHGSAGAQTIGATVLDASSLDNLKAGLATLGASLSAQGDLLLYGCDVAQGDSGQALVRQLAQLTGADVAASTDRTGASGNWALEQSAGAIEAQALAVTEWQGDLAITITGTKVNEGSPFAPFTVTGLTAGQIAMLGVSDKTTSGMVNAGIKYSLDNGTTWSDYTGSITMPTGFTATSKMLVAVSDSPETKGSIAVEGIERFQLALKLLPSSTSFQVETPNFLLAGESERFTTTQLTGSKSVFGFNSNWADMDSFTRNLVLGPQTIGKVTFPRPTDYNIYGGANGSKFVTASDEAPVTINLTVPQNYFGFWWSAGDDENILEFYKGDQLVETFKADLMNDKFPESQFGNPYVKDEDGLKSTTLLPQEQQANQGEKYAFLNFFMKGGKTFDKVVMRGSNFEFDNLTFLSSTTSSTVGDGTIVDDGSGAFIKLDASGNPIVDANGNFVTDPNAFVDNDYDNTPSLNDCAYVAPINLLVNDVASSSTRTLDPASIKLFSSLSSTGTGEGGQTLATSLGEFKLTPTGMLFFNPNASFNGATDKITIFYTVKDSSGSESTRTAITLDAAAVTAPMASSSGSMTPWRTTDANATELFNFDANGNKVSAIRTATGTGVATATSLTVNLQTNSDNDKGGDTVSGPVQARLKIDTTAIATTSGNNLAMGLQIPQTGNFGDFVDLAGITNSQTAADLRSDPYDDYNTTVKYWLNELGAKGGVIEDTPSQDFYTSQQVDIQQNWTDFDPMVNSWVKFQTGSLTPLLNKATATAWQIGTITLSFQNPTGGGLGVDNPLIHLANLGGGSFENGNYYSRFGNVGAQLQLASALDASGNAITGTTLSKLSGDANMTVTSNTIGNPNGYTSNGTVKINGTGVASVTFNVLMKGYSETEGKSAWDTTYPGNFNSDNTPDTFYLSTSAFIGPDSQGPVATAAGADAMKATKVCGVNNVVVNEGSPYAMFQVGGFEGSQILDLNLSSGTGSYGVDTGTALEYYDPSANNGEGAWITYTGGPLTIPENGDGSDYMPTKLLVRVAITNDAPADNGEQLTLSVTYPSRTDTGTLTIKDDGTGSVFGTDNTTGNPDPVDTRFPHTALNDDVLDPTPLTINNLEVNEGSPYAIFTVTGKEGQTLSLGSLTSGTGTSGVDTGTAGDTSTTPLEYWNGKDWVSYTPGQAIRLGLGSDNVLDPAATASLLVRVAVKPDLLNEISERLTLTATNTGGVASTGTLDIVDRNNGTLFGPNNTTGTPDPVGTPGVPEWRDDDTPDSRPVAINSVTVNEASPFAVFTVTAAAGQRVVLGQPTSGSADVGTDTGTGLEYYNPATGQWTAYIPGSQVETPASGSFLVRVAVVQDAPFEGPQTFTITASNVNGDSVTGTGTIVDDGTGTLFATRADKPGTTTNEAVTGVNPDGTPVLNTSTPKDDDRPIAVNSVAVNEASPFIVFTVNGGPGQAVKLSTANITANVGTDTSPAMQYFNGTQWVNYTRGGEVPIGADGQLLVRLAVTQDAQSEGTEKFNLIATTLTNKTAKGVGSISDDGTGSLFAATNTTGTPDPLGSPALPSTLTALDQDGAPPQSCWNLEPTEIIQGLKLAFNEYVDPTSIDLNPAVAGQQTSRDMFDVNNVKLGTYEASADGLLTFVPTTAFRGTGVPAIDISLSIKSYALDSNNQIVLDEAGEPVPGTAAPRTEQHKMALGASSTAYVPTGATYSGQANVLFGSYMDGTAWSREAMYLTRAMIDSWIDPADQTDPQFGINRNVLLEAPAPIKFYDPVTGLDRSAATLQRIKDAFLPAYQAIEPSLDSVAWIAGDINGRPAWDLIWYNSTAPLKPLTNWTSTTDAAASVGRGHWLVSQPESSLSDPKTSGLSTRGDFWGQRVQTFSSNAPVPVLRAVHTFGVPLTEVCGVNNVTVNEGSPYAIFEVGGFEGNSISALQLSSGTGTLGVDTGSTLQYFNGTDWVNYVPGQPITIPSDGDNQPYEATKLLVRVAITNDAPLETVNGVGETLTLKASYAFTTGPGPEKTGTLTILDNGNGQVFGEANTTGTPDNPTTSTDPTVPRFLDDDFRPTAPETCWAVTSVNIADKITLGALEAIDFSTVDMDVFTAGRQTNRTVQLNGVDVGTYSVDSQGKVRFTGTAAFRGQAPEVFYSVDVVNKNTGAFIRKELAGFQVGDDGVKTLTETKKANVAYSTIPTSYFRRIGDTVYLTGALEYPADKQYPSTVGKFFKVWDASNGFTITDEMVSEISAAYVAAYKVLNPSVDKVLLTVTKDAAGVDQLNVIAYNSANLLDPNVIKGSPKDLALIFSPVPQDGEYFWGAGEIADFDIPLVYATNVPIQGLPVTEVCGVNSVVVNEGSPWAVFQVGGFETGTISKLELSSGTGTAGVDTGAAIEYFNGSAWVPYTGGPVTVPDDGDRTYIEPTKLLVRVAINQDAPYEVREELKLTATYAFGPVKTGTLTILDDGTGSVFGTANTTGTPDVIGTSTDPSLPTRLDDDRPLSVDNVWGYEGDGFLGFTVSGVPGQPLTLGLQPGSAALGDVTASGTDAANSLEVWNPAANNGAGAWVPYTTGSSTTIPPGGDGTLKVRVAVAADATAESPESFRLVATNANGLSATGTGTIIDGAALPTGINDVTVNEASPWAVFTVNGVGGQKVKLDLFDGTGVEGVDTNALQYLDPTDNTWKVYTPGQEVTLPSNGRIQVRVGIVNDAPFEQSEQLKLQATFDNGMVETGTLTILDDGTGSVFGNTNTTGTPTTPGTDGTPATLNNDRGNGPLVNSIVVNEASPYAVFTLKGVAGAGVALELRDGITADKAERTGTDADIGQALEFWNASTSTWVTYNPAAPNATFGSNGQLLVRVAVVNDEPLEISEDFTLRATYNNRGVTAGITVGASSTGQGVIKDDGTGTVFAGAPADPLSGAPAVPGVDALGNPQIDPTAPKDTDALNISNLVLNEGSPYAVFSVGSPIAGAQVTLALGDGKATLAGGDYTHALQVWNPTTSQWDPYTPGQLLTVPSADAPLLVRTALGNQAALEGAEPFKLTATMPTGATKSGTATILDDGRGDIFSGAITPATGTQPATPVKLPVANTPVANPSTQTVADDDRPLTVNNVTVNEGSPFAVFTVGGREGQYVQLGLANGTATVGTDTGTNLEYWNGTAWTAYTPGTFVKIPADTDTVAGEPAGLLVRVPVVQDTPFEVSETFKLQATNTGGTTAEGTGTIKDDGTGDHFATRADDPNTPANEAVPGVNPDGTPAVNNNAVKDDDRTFDVNDVVVNEASPFIVFTVTGTEGGRFALATTSGTAVLGVDTGTPLQYFNGQAWVDYTPGSLLTMPSDGDTTPGEPNTMLVRLAVNQDKNFEVSESFKLKATTPSGNAGRVGTGTILDDGTGTIFAARADDPNTPTNEAVSGVNPDGTPVLDTATPKDDDRPLTVTGSTVREPGTGQTGFMPFTVSGIEGQPVKLALASDSGTVGTDTGSQLQYWSGSQWVNYDPLNPPTIPQVGSGLNGETGTLQVRVAVNPDAPSEGTESISLVATNRNGTAFMAPGYILEGAGTLVPDAPPIAVTGQTVNEASPYLVYKVSGLIGQGLSLNLAPTGNGNGHVDTDADISCHLPVTTVNVLANDFGGSAGLDPATVQLFNAATGGVGSNTLTVTGQGTYTANPDGTVSFTPVDGLVQGATLTPVYYSVKNSANLESARVAVNLNAGARSDQAATGAWWEVDLGSQVSIDSIKVWNRTDSGLGSRLDGAVVLILDANRQVVGSLPLSNPAQSSETVTPSNPAMGRYVKVQLPGLGVLSLAEVEVFSGNTNVALNRLATQSSLGAGGVPERAVDGNTDGNYFAGTPSVTHTNPGNPAVAGVDGTAGGTGANLACQELEYFNGTNWVHYVPGSTVNIPGATNGQPGELLVRARVVNDGVFEGPETLDLVATSTNGYVASGTGTIVDDGTGLINTNTVTNGAPVLDTSTPCNDDRGATPSVSSFTVNEASPFGVFTVTGVPGAGLTLGLANGTAESEDRGTALEFFDVATSSWKAYTPGTPNAVVQPDGRLLVRVAINNDAPFEGPESFNLTATYNGTGSPASPVTLNGASTGTATIVDDGTGQIFLTRNDDPLTPANEANLGVMDGNRPQMDDMAPKDDDRGVSVGDVTVNEGSPYIVFSLDSFVGQKLRVTLDSGTATLGDVTQSGVDAANGLQYWTGSAWVAYTPDSFIDVPAGPGDVPGAAKSVLVRVAVKQDQPYEVSESFTLRASTASGKSDSATGTIVDNGTGQLFSAANNTGTPENPGQNGLPATRDDDRPFNPAFINDLRINEGSPWAVFTINGVPTAQITLSLPSGTAVGDATLATDYQDGLQPGELQVFIGGQWVDYNPAAAYPAGGWSGNDATKLSNAVLDANGKLLVRVKLENQVPFEDEESFRVNLQYTGNWAQSQFNNANSAQPLTGPAHVFSGNAVIVDDGSGLVFGNTNTTGTPTTPGADGTPALLDDDRPLVVGDATVNEGSPYIVMPVTGNAGQWVKLEVASDTATVGTDTGTQLQYFNGSQWVDYTPGSFVQIPTLPGQTAGRDQNLLVRLAVVNDTPYERSEGFTLKATNTGGGFDTGVGTILDDGSGPVYATGMPGQPSGVTVDPATNQLVPVNLPAAPRNDDRPVTVDSVNVNEGSPFAVFTVTAAQGEPLLLSLASGTAQVGTDTRGGIEYFDATSQSWTRYVGLPVTVPANGSGAVVPMLVRVAITPDAPLEGEETFTLKAQYADGNKASATGVGTISDDGTGDIFATRADDPTTSANEAVPGVNSDGTPAKVMAATAAVVNPATSADPLADDDRPVTVNDLTVNEGSPFAVFTVGAREGQYVKLELAAGTATAGTDYANALEYWDGDSWEAYAPGTFIKVPTDGDGSANEEANLLVRVAIKTDTLLDGGETFTLKATNTGGSSDVGTGTIVDDGTGLVFDPTVNPATASEAATPKTVTPASASVVDPATTTAPLADDDRPLRVNNVEVNEASPYLVWTVDAKQGQYVKLSVASGTAMLGTDTGTELQYWNGSAWTDYTPDTFVKVPGRNIEADGQLLVRVAVKQDNVFEERETLTLTATNTGGTSATGQGAIRDDGTGTIYLSGLDDPALPGVQNPTGVDADGLPQVQAPSSAFAVSPGQALIADNDRPVTVNNVEVNEASPYLVWTVSARQGQYVSLALGSTGTGDGFATLDKDTGNADQLQVFNGSAWVNYVPGTLVRVPGSQLTSEGQLLVRVSVKNDFRFEDVEGLKLTAANDAGSQAVGTGRIRDDGQGLLFGPDNTTAVPDTLAALGLQVLDDDRVAPPPPQRAEAPRPAEEPPQPATGPSLHVQLAVAEGRQAVSTVSGDSTAGVVTSRAISGVGEGRNVLRRMDALIDKFDRVTDPNLYVLPEVKSTRGQSFDAAVPAFTLQSGLLAEEIAPMGSRAVNVQLSAAPTSADQTLAELMQVPAPVYMAEAEEATEAERLAQKQALHLAAARAAEQADAKAAQALPRGQFGFSKQLQMSAAKRNAAPARTLA